MSADTTTWRLFGRGALIIACVGIMAFAPALALNKPRPAMFGWQMYSAQPTSPLIYVATVDGEIRMHSLSDFVPRWRPDIDYASRAPQLICASDPTIASVGMRRDAPEMDVRVICER